MRDRTGEDAAARWAKLAAALLGVVLFAAVLDGVDLAGALRLVGALGASILLVFLVAFLAFAADALSWLAVAPGLRFAAPDAVRIAAARLVGDMLNAVTPLAGVGGEPAKALILVRRLGVDPHGAIASVLVARTTILLAYVPFFGVGVALMAASPLPGSYAAAAGAGFALYTAAIVGFLLAQRYGLASRLGRLLGRIPIAARIERAAAGVAAVEAELAALYVSAPARLSGSLALAFAGWVLGAAELWVASDLLGHSLTFAEAWLIEAAVQFLRQATGFIPASLGVTEATLALLYAALAGDATLGVAVALVRRLRELVWIAGGLALGAHYLRGRRPEKEPR
jgi:uncharacterized membrane protein YbhN (UPF0104 family)